MSKNLTQEVLEFIAHQPTNPGPDGSSGGELGYKEARRILETGGDERAAYLSRFQEQNPQYAIQSINGAGAQSALNSQYETQAQQQKNSADLQTQHASNNQSVHQSAQNSGFHKEKIENLPKDQSVKNDVLQQFNHTEDKINKGSDKISTQERTLQKAEEEAQKKTLGGTATKNLFKSAGVGLSSVGTDIVDTAKKLPPLPPVIFP